MRDRRLQGVEAVVERQERVPAESDDTASSSTREHSRLGFGPLRSSATEVRLRHLVTVF